VYYWVEKSFSQIAARISDDFQGREREKLFQHKSDGQSRDACFTLREEPNEIARSIE
jgi:hypothetical protein